MDKDRAPARGLRRGSRSPEAEVQRITSASAPLADDMAQRSRRYLAQMSIRVVCFLAAVAIDHWTRWVLLAGAVVLPYFAVVLANAGRERGSDPGTFVGAPVLPPGLTPAADLPTSTPGDVR
ncbi:DUF3099 domain-containing protein [Actinotalea sp. K2]|uniref:DUF3099 domain-containing protein n=1 Tax=Actinotalea sp. K2 TaxID=2939438 RepID=UPI002017E5B9|nr:DUF3099 domain-containing protein [Actinotalea sp. K2]MCL3861948.1 DUF3099 domain-containing protein [Actinotalea sp. K2]